MKTIPSYITLHYERSPTFQRAPELLRDVVLPEGTWVSRDWVVVGRADTIETIIENGGDTVIEIGSRRWSGDRARSPYGKTTRVTLVGIVGIRYVNHREHGRTHYLAASIKKFTEEEKMAWYRERRQLSRRIRRN